MRHGERKVALVSQDIAGFDFAGHTQTIAKLCDEQGCETILYSLFSLHLGDGQWSTNYDMIFGSSKNIKTVILEAGDLSLNGKTRIEVWHRNRKTPDVHYRIFAKSSDSDEKKQQLMDEFDSRCKGDSALLICGEVNIISTSRAGKDKVIDDYCFLNRLRKSNIKVVFGPAHTAFKRFEMPIKKKIISKENRYFISTWCKDKYTGREPKNPWQIFYDGQDVSDQVKEIESPIAKRPDIRIGIITIK